MRESNNSENKIIIQKKTRCFYMGIKQQWKLNNNNKRTHDVFIRESNNNENYIIIIKEHMMFL